MVALCKKSTCVSAYVCVCVCVRVHRSISISRFIFTDGLHHACNLHKKPIVAQGSLCFGAPSDCFENPVQTMACSPHARKRRWNPSSGLQLRRPASASGCVENASVDVSRCDEDSPGPCTNVRKRPSATNETHLRRPASAGGVVVQRAETRAGLDNSSTDIADKKVKELLRCEYAMRKIFSLTREAGELSTAQIAEIEALKIQQKYVADEIFWNGIFS